MKSPLLSPKAIIEIQNLILANHTPNEPPSEMFVEPVVVLSEE